MTATFNSQGQVLEAAMYGPDGKPCIGKDGYARMVARYDRNGKRTEEAYFGVDGKPTRMRGPFAGAAQGEPEV